MSNIITHLQTEEMFGQNSDTLNLLLSLLKKHPEKIYHFENFKEAILVFNDIGIEVDLSIRFKSEAFN